MSSCLTLPTKDKLYQRTYPLDGSNCKMNGRRAVVRTLSSIKSSNSFIVDACSMIDSGVVKTMCNAVGDSEDAEEVVDFEEV